MGRRPRKSQQFNALLRKAREAAGLTQEQLAGRANLTAGHISKLERGAHKPSLANIELLAAALDIAPAALVGDERRYRDSDAPGAA